MSIYLVNGIKLQGQIDSFDQFVVLLKNTVSQMVYKHAISTVVRSARPCGWRSKRPGVMENCGRVTHGSRHRHVRTPARR